MADFLLIQWSRFGSNSVGSMASAVAFLLLWHGALHAAPVVMDKSLTTLNTTGSMEYFEDRQGTIDIEKARVHTGAGDWNTNKKDYINFGFTSSFYWFKITISNPHAIPDRLLLEIDNPYLDQIEWYYPDGRGGYGRVATGAGLPFATRSVRDRNFIFPLQPLPGDSTCYLRIRSIGLLRFQALLHAEDALLEQRVRYLPLIWFLYGMFLLTGAFYLVLFAFLRDRVYLYFSFIGICVFFFQFIQRGFAFQFLWPSWPRLTYVAAAVTINIAEIFSVLFLQRILDTRSAGPVFHRLFNLFGFLIFPALVLQSFVLPLHIVTRETYYVQFSYLVLVIFTTIYFIGRGNRLARYLLAGNALFGLGGIITILTALGRLPMLPLTGWSTEAGFLLLVFFSSLGLVDRFKTMTDTIRESELSLQEKNALLTRANVDLRASLDEKIALIKEVHHRVKNNMQVVSSLLDLQVQTLKEPMAREALTGAVARIHAMASIHECIYRTESFSKVDMAAHLDELSRDLVSLYGGSAARNGAIQVNCRLSPIFLSVDLAIPCGLLISEILANAIKHGSGGSAGNCIDLTMERTDGRLIFVIADRGPGMPRELFEAEHKTTLGMQIIDTLAQQIGAIVTLEVDQGTRFIVQVPDSNTAGG